MIKHLLWSVVGEPRHFGRSLTMLGTERSRARLGSTRRLLISGQSPLGFFSPLAWSLRRFGVAAQLVEQAERCGQRPNLTQCLEQAGFRKFDLKKAEVQLRRIGRPRAKMLLNWIVELELKLKGTHSNDHAAKFAIEEFLTRLA